MGRMKKDEKTTLQAKIAAMSSATFYAAGVKPLLQSASFHEEQPLDCITCGARIFASEDQALDAVNDNELLCPCRNDEIEDAHSMQNMAMLALLHTQGELSVTKLAAYFSLTGVATAESLRLVQQTALRLEDKRWVKVTEHVPEVTEYVQVPVGEPVVMATIRTEDGLLALIQQVVVKEVPVVGKPEVYVTLAA
jgi:hypothetical protein